MPLLMIRAAKEQQTTERTQKTNDRHIHNRNIMEIMVVPPVRVEMGDDANSNSYITHQQQQCHRQRQQHQQPQQQNERVILFRVAPQRKKQRDSNAWYLRILCILNPKPFSSRCSPPRAFRSGVGEPMASESLSAKGLLSVSHRWTVDTANGELRGTSRAFSVS